jgi:hypothetical protein
MRAVHGHHGGRAQQQVVGVGQPHHSGGYGICVVDLTVTVRRPGGRPRHNP